MSAVQKRAAKCKILGLLALSLCFVCFASVASAQGYGAPDTHYYVGYYGNANMGFPDAQLDIVNPGSTGGYSAFNPSAPPGVPFGDLCANVYVFTSDQEMVECCSCFISPNGQIQLSLAVDLTSNPVANSAVVPLPNAGAIKLVSSATNSGACNVSAAEGSATQDIAGTIYSPWGSLRAWNTHVRETAGATTTSLNGVFTESEVMFQQAHLSYDGTELGKLQADCSFILGNGSGHGHCTCGGAPN